MFYSLFSPIEHVSCHMMAASLHTRFPYATPDRCGTNLSCGCVCLSLLLSILQTLSFWNGLFTRALRPLHTCLDVVHFTVICTARFPVSPIASKKDLPHRSSMFHRHYHVRSEGAYCSRPRLLCMFLTEPGSGVPPTLLCVGFMLYCCWPDEPCGARGGEGRQVSRGSGLGEQGAGCRGESVLSALRPWSRVLCLDRKGAQQQYNGDRWMSFS